MMMAIMNISAPIAPPIAAPDDPDPLSPTFSSIADPPFVLPGSPNNVTKPW